MNARLQPKPHTPWGYADSVEVITEGLTRYDTPSHGGYGLSREKWLQMPEALRYVPTWAGERWYEEDVDWAIVALAFPEHFDDLAIMHAIDTVLAKDSSIHLASYFLRATPDGRALKLRAEEYRRANGARYVTGSMCTSGSDSHWYVTARTLMGDGRIGFHVPNGVTLPPQPYSVEELRGVGIVV